MLSFNSILFASFAGLLLASFAIVRVRSLRAAKLLRTATLLRGSKH